MGVHVEVIVTCVCYADFLAITLQQTKRWFAAITVLTAPEDYETIALAQREGVSLHVTSVWGKNGAKFNKAGAINSCLDERDLDGTDSWVVLLDADILLREDFRGDVMTVDPHGLYSIPRRMCETEEEWRALRAGRRRLEDLPLSIPPVVNGRVWKHRPTGNPAALCGYLQLWHATKAAGMKRMPASHNAAGYDVEFGLSFPEASRSFLKGREVLHLGPSKANWDGRVSPRWGPPPMRPLGVPVWPDQGEHLHL